MSEAERGQVNKSAADVYEEFFVPALFQGWAAPVCDAAGIGAGERVLDVACGTGVLSREALKRVGAEGLVVGLDRNEGMLEVARRTAPGVDWRTGRAESLPFADGDFDAVACQFGLMFFEDRLASLSEMWRVTKPGGRVAVAVWDGLERSPGYAAVTALLDRMFGAEMAAAMEAPFNLGAPDTLMGFFEAAEIGGAELQTLAGTARFPSIDAWVHTDIKGWTLADMIDDAGFARFLAAARVELKRFETPEGSVAFSSPAHIVTAHKV